MPITINCPYCRETLRFRDEAVGKRIACRYCQESILVDAGESIDQGEFDNEGEPPDGMPQKAKETIFALATAGLLWSVFGGMGLYLMATDDIDTLGRAITYYLVTLGIMGFICSGLLWRKISAAKYIAAVVSIFYLLFFPLGTIVAVIIYRGLFSTDLDEYLSSGKGRVSQSG